MSLIWPGPRPPAIGVAHPRTMRRLMQESWNARHQVEKRMIREERESALSVNRNSVADIPSLASQLCDPNDASRSYGSNADVRWMHQVWAINPMTGDWYEARHVWTAKPEARTALRGPQQCLICSGDEVDETTSVSTFMPELARDFSDDRVRFADVPMGLHLAGKRKWAFLADGKGYATLLWTCKVHGDFKATMSNRTAEHGGTGCPKCGPRGLSKEQLRIAFQIKSLIPDCDFDPAPLNVPEDLRSSAAWRSSVVRPDIVLPSHGVIVEYDGEFGHRSTLRPEAKERTRRQTTVFLGLGYHVIRLSVGPVAGGESRTTDERNGNREISVSLPPPMNLHQAALSVFECIQSLGSNPLPGLSEYRVGLDLQAEGQATAEIRRLWGASGKQRRQRNSKGRISKYRTIEPGERVGHLVVLDAPPKLSGSGRRRGDHLVPCRCDCGNEALVDAQDLRRTRTPKEHCGPRCPLIPRPKVEPLLVGESVPTIRHWARSHGYQVGRSGRIPREVLSAYRAANPT